MVPTNRPKVVAFIINISDVVLSVIRRNLTFCSGLIPIRYNIRHLFFAIATIAFLLAALKLYGVFDGNFEKQNAKIIELLEGDAEHSFVGYTAGDVAEFLENKHGIRVEIRSLDRSKKLTSPYLLGGMRRETSLRIALYAIEFSFFVENGRLQICDRDDLQAKVFLESRVTKPDFVEP